MTVENRVVISLLALAFAGGACGRSEAPKATGSSGTGAAATPPAAVERAAPAVHDGRKVEIAAGDTMKFTVLEIRAKAGERLSVTLVNMGKTPKLSMGHNWVLLAAGADPEAFDLTAAESPTTEYMPASKKAEILAATKLLGPNEQDTATFNAPGAPGRYTFLCTFPGHFQLGMRGVLIVE